ncbi:mRNA (2'-O-methyladenosine-N(6)-)-methyltransferase [Malassezia cuniculi]|uniref:mRNA m(6)A methyltransferase n=1 Tax=Malassezia cuniculi TaxID=948313 RepID=A0AAF0J5E4_9BASI|nr:mRNA (2'-O-methyladenosine-N(6)-)-methyltransferase [Malassezia cuniculi]
MSDAHIAERFVNRPTGKERVLAHVRSGIVGNACKFVHFQVDVKAYEAVHGAPPPARPNDTPSEKLYACGLDAWVRGATQPAQWINCDLRTFDLSKVGKYDVLVLDPPWDIHMSLPYGTMSDSDMYALDVPALQDEGLIFLWVTGRAMELGRSLLQHWGYYCIDELLWLKMGQTHRLIRTGRTGHWLNHAKEHCLVGLKRAADDQRPPTLPPGAIVPLPRWVHKGMGTDVIVSHVRYTSHKPDELYAMIERMCPGARKIELFGRRHNIRPGWLTLGNQLRDSHVRSKPVEAPAEDTEPLLTRAKYHPAPVVIPKPAADELLDELKSGMMPISTPSDGTAERVATPVDLMDTPVDADLLSRLQAALPQT